MTEEQLTPELLAYLGGVLASLMWELVPSLKQWFDGLSSLVKRLVIAASTLVVTLVVFGLGCSGFLSAIAPNFDVACSTQGALILLTLYIKAVIASQASFTLLVRKERPSIAAECLE